MSETAIQPSTTVTCQWCGCAYGSDQLSCPACGAPGGPKPRLSSSGWVELPPIRDMARIRFGQSTCQIEGDMTPVADVNLAAGDGLYFMHHAMLWRDLGMTTSVMPMASGFKRFMSGMPLVMLQASGPGRMAFSGMNAGEMFAVPLPPGHAIDVREHMLLVAEQSVRYEFFDPHIWYTSDEGNSQVTRYPVGMFMDRFTASETPGVVLLHAPGNVFLRDLAPAESLWIQASALVYKSPSVGMRLQVDEPALSGMAAVFSRGMHRFLFLELTGPGRVAVRSVFEQPENLDTLRRHSN